MRVLIITGLLCVATAWAQTPAPKPPAAAPAPVPEPLTPDTVIATFGNGVKITYGEVQRYMGFLPSQQQQAALRDRKAFVQAYALMHRLADMAEEAKLDQESPTTEELKLNRMYIMMNAQVNHAVNDIIIPEPETRKYYDQHQDRFTQVKVKVIYVSFTANGGTSSTGKKYLTEPEAKAKVEKLRDQLRAGADFVKLVKENSDDQTSAAKDGDFGTIRRTDNIPEAIRKAIFALKPGEISDPIRQPNGFYLFRVESASVRPLPEVKDEIFTQLKQERFHDWMEKTRNALNIKFGDNAFINPPAAPPAGK